MSIQPLLPASHAGQRIARHVLVALFVAIVVTSMLSLSLAELVSP